MSNKFIYYTGTWTESQLKTGMARKDVFTNKVYVWLMGEWVVCDYEFGIYLTSHGSQITEEEAFLEMI